VLISDPRNAGLTRTWELGGRTIEPTVLVSPNSRLDITDTANLGTTYIKNIIRLGNLVRNILSIAKILNNIKLINKLDGYQEKLIRDIVITDSLYI
jgi:K+-sensing histidine kinase KdpD